MMPNPAYLMRVLLHSAAGRPHRDLGHSREFAPAFAREASDGTDRTVNCARVRLKGLRSRLRRLDYNRPTASGGSVRPQFRRSPPPWTYEKIFPHDSG